MEKDISNYSKQKSDTQITTEPKVFDAPIEQSIICKWYKVQKLIKEQITLNEISNL